MLQMAFFALKEELTQEAFFAENNVFSLYFRLFMFLDIAQRHSSQERLKKNPNIIRREPIRNLLCFT